MDGDGLSAHVPLLTNKDFEPGYPKNTPLLKSLIKWVLKVLMWAIFVAWVAIIFILPTTFGQQKYQKWIAATKGTVFGHTGSTFLLFSGPVLAIAFLSVPYIIVSSTDDFYKKKKKSYPRFRLWTFPVLIDGPFGVVSAAELIGIFLFAAYIVWTVSYYTIQNYNKVTKFHLPTIEESSLMLEYSGLRFGSIGLFCLAFLFLPVARGSFLLRLIDIPFEHATRYHVWLGHLTMLIFTLHGIFYLVAWTMQHRLLHEMLEWADIGICNFAGVISLLAGLLMWVTSLHFVRKEYFELFFYTHQLYVVFVVFLALHVGDFIFTIAAGGIFLFLLDRFLRFFQSRKAVDVISAKCLPCGTVEIVLSKPKNMRYNALSFIFLQVRELSWLQWHPFSVSSSPLDGENHISVLIKVLGEWTNNLRNTISTEEPMMDLPFQPSSSITASVEGPYGHESPYHLMYENLILVAGGIGISPFLAILRDILHRVKEKKPCLPEKVLIIWAVKKSNELSLLSASDLESICSYFSDKLDLEIQIYVTQESEPPLEEGEVHTNMESNYFPDSNRSAMSGLVGTGNNIWSGVYLVIPIIGFVILVALTDIFYINSYGIYSWWFKGLIFVACMIASVVIFGGLVVFCWHSYDECLEDDSKKSEPIQYHKPVLHTTTADGTFDSLTTTRYGRRPDFQELFGSISERWGHVDVGVIVCGPPTLQSSVARACRVQNIRRGKNHPFFHFNSHSFDL